MRRRFVIMSVVLLLTACAVQRWVQKGKTHAEADQALVECKSEIASPSSASAAASSTPAPPSTSREYVLPTALDACMMRKGYRLE